MPRSMPAPLFLKGRNGEDSGTTIKWVELFEYLEKDDEERIAEEYLKNEILLPENLETEYKDMEVQVFKITDAINKDFAERPEMKTRLHNALNSYLIIKGGKDAEQKRGIRNTKSTGEPDY